MSKRNAYEIKVDKSSEEFRSLLNRLNDVFMGHVQEKDSYIFAEDSPGVDMAFEEDPRYVSFSEVKSILNDHKNAVVEVTHIYANDTSGERTRNTLQLEEL